MKPTDEKRAYLAKYFQGSYHRPWWVPGNVLSSVGNACAADGYLAYDNRARCYTLTHAGLAAIGETP